MRRSPQLTGLLLLLLSGTESPSCNRQTAAPPLPPPPAETTVEAPEPTVVSLADEPAAPPRDLAQIREAGVVRFLLQRGETAALPRDGSPAARDLARAWELADRLELKPRFVIADDPAALAKGLADGRGDVLLTPIEPGATPTSIATTTPLKSVAEVVVVAATFKGPKRIRKSLLDIRPLKLAVRPNSRAADTLARLDPQHMLATIPVSTTLDDEELLAKVAAGSLDAALIDDDSWDFFRTYNQDVKPEFILREKVQLAWGVRADATKLLEAVNGAIYESAMTGHRRLEYGGDLDEILKRKVLRVAMLNNGASYFLYRGQEAGFQYELAHLFADRLGVRLQVVVPDRPGDLEKLLTEHKVDLAPIPLVGSGDSAFAYTIPFIQADQLLVQPAGETPITTVAALNGRVVHVRHSSEYDATLHKLSLQAPGLQIVAASEDLETEELIDMVGKKQIPLTVANSVLLRVELAWRDDIQGTLSLAESQPLVYGLRKDAPQLRERMNKLIERELSSSAYDVIYSRYFQNAKLMRELRTEDTAVSGRISPFDDLIRRYGDRYGIDWRLIAAQMYQESRFDPNAKSWVGAMGLMQVMPKTGRELGFKSVRAPDDNISAGVKYMARLITATENELPMRQRVRFALAGYNAGMGHVADARLLARKMGLDPNRWFGNVAKAMLLLEKPAYYHRARRGYCRGSEPVSYVSRIQTKYDAYAALMPAEGTSLQGD